MPRGCAATTWQRDPTLPAPRPPRDRTRPRPRPRRRASAVAATRLMTLQGVAVAVLAALAALFPAAASADQIDDGVGGADAAAATPWLAIAAVVILLLLGALLVVRTRQRRRRRREHLDAALDDLEWLAAEATDVEHTEDPAALATEVRQRGDRIREHLITLGSLGGSEVRDAASDLRTHASELAQTLVIRLTDAAAPDRHRLDVRLGELRERTRVGSDRLVATVRR